MFEEHNKLVEVISLVSQVYFSDEFVSLRDELEVLYHDNEESHYLQRAFQDALYSVICERDS